MKFVDLIKKLQSSMNALGQSPPLVVDGDPGPKTRGALEGYDLEVTVKKKQQNSEPPSAAAPVTRKTAPWYSFALRFKGKKETDPAFNREMSAQWKLFGMNLGTIAQSWAAWCGLAMAVALSGVGVDYAKNGALAKNWAKYGVEIDYKRDGIPQAAIVQINATKCGSDSGNHVAQANGDCTAADLAKPDATIDLYGGNQGNTWKVSTYAASKICAVRWPKDVKDFPPPGRITKSVNCTSRNTSHESTR